MIKSRESNLKETELSSTFSAEKENSLASTPKSKNKNPSDVRRWASIVKSNKNLQNLPEQNVSNSEPDKGNESTSEILEHIFKTFPKSFENHKAFIIGNTNTFSCSVCSFDIVSLLDISNHFKTRNHEDNVIKFLKEKVPNHLEHTMEFVSFYGSSLCCNLCRCKINMSPDNPFETIVNIISHNTNVSHTSKKLSQDATNQADKLLKTLTTISIEVKENICFIEHEMNPQFKCKLCNKNIIYDKELELLRQNFVSHLRSAGHIRSQRAVEILKFFIGEHTNVSDHFFISNGNILCTFCNCQVEADIDKLMCHENGVEHAQNVLAKLEGPPWLNNILKNKSNTSSTADEVKLMAFCVTNKKEEKEKIETTKENNKKQLSSRLNDLINSLPLEIRHVKCLMENDKGSITCLICDCEVPPSIYNLRTHLLGNNHKKTEDSQKTFKFDEVKKNYLPQALLKTRGIKENEKLSMNNCPEGCVHKSSLLRKIPKAVRVYNCHRIPIKIPSTILLYHYDLLLKKSPLVSENENFLVKNVDGQHSYCKKCKSLIPLSVELNTMEENIVSHLIGKRHNTDLPENNTENTAFSSSTKTVVRSLFLGQNDTESQKDFNEGKHDCMDSNCLPHSVYNTAMFRSISGHDDGIRERSFAM